MRPVLKGGELAYAEPYTGQPLVGRIVCTTRFTHRVTAENKLAVYTSGDANKYSDGWSPKGEVRWVIRYVVR